MQKKIVNKMVIKLFYLCLFINLYKVEQNKLVLFYYSNIYYLFLFFSGYLMIYNYYNAENCVYFVCQNLL